MPRIPDDEEQEEQEDDDEEGGEFPEDIEDILEDLAEQYDYDTIEDFLDDHPYAYELWEDDYLDYLDELDQYDDEDFYGKK